MASSCDDLLSRLLPLSAPGGQVIVENLANDNALGVRALTPSDARIIIRENAAVFGTILDVAARYEAYASAPILPAIKEVIQGSPDIQCAIVWRGTRLSREDVDRLRDRGSLHRTCCEVIRTTRLSEFDDRIKAIFREEVLPFSGYLQGGRC